MIIQGQNIFIDDHHLGVMAFMEQYNIVLISAIVLVSPSVCEALNQAKDYLYNITQTWSKIKIKETLNSIFGYDFCNGIVIKRTIIVIIELNYKSAVSFDAEELK